MCIVLRIKWVLITGMVFLLLSWNCPFVLARTVVKVPERAKVNSKLTSLGEIIHIAQSLVGNVLSSSLITPPMADDFSTR